MEQVEISVESYDIYAEIFDMCSTLQTSMRQSNSSTHIRVSDAGSGRDCVIADWYTWSFLYPYRHESRGIRSWGLKGQGIGPV
jgi:hypothetical protein